MSRLHEPPPPALRPPARGLRWTIPIAGALAVAAIAMVILRPRGEPDAPGERAKGGTIELVLFSGQPDRLTALTDQGQLFAGDLLQAGYTSPVDGYGAVLSLDAAGNASVYVPAVGSAMVLLPAGERRSFPASTQLDDVVGAETLAVVWCAHPRPIAPLLDELQATRTLGRRDDCAVRVFAVTKR